MSYLEAYRDALESNSSVQMSEARILLNENV